VSERADHRTMESNTDEAAQSLSFISSLHVQSIHQSIKAFDENVSIKEARESCGCFVSSKAAVAAHASEKERHGVLVLCDIVLVIYRDFRRHFRPARIWFLR